MLRLERFHLSHAWATSGEMMNHWEVGLSARGISMGAGGYAVVSATTSCVSMIASLRWASLSLFLRGALFEVDARELAGLQMLLEAGCCAHGEPHLHALRMGGAWMGEVAVGVLPGDFPDFRAVVAAFGMA